MTNNITKIIDDCRLMQPDHEGNNAWPSIRTETVTALCDEVERLQAQRDTMLTVLEELDECAAYWSEYDVPLGLHDRIKAAIKLGRGE